MPDRMRFAFTRVARGLATLLFVLAAYAAPAFVPSALAQTDKPQALPLNHLYIALSDAMGAAKQGDPAKATAMLQRMQGDFEQIEARRSVQGLRVGNSLEQAIADPSATRLAAVSNALRAFEQEQNPVDYTARKAELKRRMTPAHQQLAQAIAQSSAQDTSALAPAYQRFNTAWLASERVVRNTSLGHYGAIETALALMRVAIETQPVDLDKVRFQSDQLQRALESYYSGQGMAVAETGLELSDGLQLLRDGLAAFQARNPNEGQARLTRFIEVWPVIEGAVSTRAPELYSRVESQVPVILAHGDRPEQQAALQSLINELATIDPQARYTAVDAMLILLREGLEALLIVMALVSALNAAGQPAGRRWIYGGVLAGLLASVLGAVALQRLFPLAAAGSQREMMEGLVGIFTVLMMLVVGAWLHSKSSLQAWNRYIQKHMGIALTGGSLLSLAGLSFLSVFREGAETILFYAGILPMITTGAFLSGIAMALAVLTVIAVVLFKTSLRLPIARMFKLLTWVIYALGFKILGVSLHALQLTGYLPLTPLQAPWLDLPSVGLYPTQETIAAQLLLLAVIAVIQIVISRGRRSTEPEIPVDMAVSRKPTA